MAPLSFTYSLREQRDLVVRHPGYRRIHPRLKPCLSAVGVNSLVKQQNKTAGEPVLGRETPEVLSKLGLSPDEILTLKKGSLSLESIVRL